MTKRKVGNNGVKKVSRWSKNVGWDRSLVVTEEDLNELADLLVVWADTDEALKVSQFYTKFYMSDKVFYGYVAKCPKLADAVDIAKKKIGDRREVGAITGRFSSTIVEKTMPMYDSEYRSLIEWKSKLGVEQEQQGSRIVVLDKIPDSNLVPEKKNE